MMSGSMINTTLHSLRICILEKTRPIEWLRSTESLDRFTLPTENRPNELELTTGRSGQTILLKSGEVRDP